MFGYVRIYKPEIKMGEFELYQGIYCSLCKRLGKRYGVIARMTLSYDFTFLSLLRMALSPACTGFKKSRCALHPLKKRTCCCDNPHVDFAADAAVMLTYHKLRDNIADRGFFSGLPARILLPFASAARKKASKRYPEMDAYIMQCMKEQDALEKAGTMSMDAAADPSARMVAYLAGMAASSEKEAKILERFGYCLGRWIYLMDAVDDLEDDLKEGGYNPYVLSRGLVRGDDEAVQETRAYSVLTLNACLAECIAAYNLLHIHRFDGILRNVLEWGMPCAQKEVVAGPADKPKKKEF